MKKPEEYAIKHLLTKIRTLMSVYDLLNNVGSTSNVVYGFQVLTGITVQFIKIVFSSFYVYYYKIVSIFLYA